MPFRSTLSVVVIMVGLLACGRPSIDQGSLKNASTRQHEFLRSLDDDAYYPQDAVDGCRAVLVQLCWAIEQEQPKELRHLYPITHYYTRQINTLQDDFERKGSELETVAGEAIAAEFEFIATAYGFQADVEELIAPRAW